MKKIVFCFSILFGLNVVALDSVDDAQTDPTLALDELFNDGQALPQFQGAQPNSYLENQKIARDYNNEINAYEALSNLIQEIKLKRAYLTNIRSRLTVTLDAVYDQNSSIDERLENIEDARRLISLYQEAIDQLIDLVEQLPGLKEAYIKVLLARREAIETRKLPSLENEEHSLITEKRKINSPYQKIQKQPKPQLNVQQITAVYNNLEVLRQALYDSNTPTDRINELGEIAFDNVQAILQIFDYSQYDLSANRANRGLLMQIQTYYTAAAQLWGSIINTDPSGEQYELDLENLLKVLTKMNRLIRRVANIEYTPKAPEVQIADLIDLLKDLKEIDQAISKRNIRFKAYLGGLTSGEFDGEEIKELLDSGTLGDQAQQIARVVYDNYQAVQKIWEPFAEEQYDANLSKAEKQKSLTVNTNKLRKALTPLISSFSELINQVNYDITHPNH